jgi:hypothetical protein
MQYVHRYVNYEGFDLFSVYVLSSMFLFFFKNRTLPIVALDYSAKQNAAVCVICVVPKYRCIAYPTCGPGPTTLQRKWAHTKDAPDPVPSQSPHRRPPLASPFPAGVKARQTP